MSTNFRGSLLRQTVTESLLIALLGLVGGVAIAYWGVELLVAFGGAELPRTDQIELDRLVLGFSALIAVTATLGFGLWPALRASRLDLVRSLKGKTVGLVSTRLVGRLVEVEVAIAFVLLSASSLLVRSLIATESIELGFRTENLISINIELLQSKYPGINERVAFHERLREEVEALPGIRGATPSLIRPGGGDFVMTGAFRFEGQAAEEARENPRSAFEWVAPSYFRVMGIPGVRLTQSLLYGVSPSDVTSFIAVALILAAVSAAATYVPARGVRRADPMTLLREE